MTADVVRPTDVDETPRPGEAPATLVRRLAVAKARADARAGELRLAADTVVALDDAIFGKPTDADDARRMLRALSDTSHEVVSGVALFDVDQDRLDSVVVTTEVTFARLGGDEIERYLATSEPFGKAGAYAIQGRAALYVEQLKGSYSNVVGLPLHATWSLFRRLGYTLPLQG